VCESPGSRNLTSIGEPELAAQTPARQFEPVPEATESARRWSGFVCPDCRFVFRVPRDHDGKGIVCPSCRRILRIPGADDSPPPLLAPVRVMESKDSDEESNTRIRKRRRGKKSKNNTTHTWEKHEGSRHRRSGKYSFLPLVAGVILLIAVIGALIFALKPAPSAPVLKPTVLSASEKPQSVAAGRSERNFLIEAEALAGKFLKARSVDEILPFVRDPAVAELRIRGWYSESVIDPSGLRDFNVNRMVETTGAVRSVYITTDDYITRQLFFVDTPEGVRIDWESWSGWSEMRWEDFTKTKPTEPKICRVLLQKSDYYNFAFKDEDKWQAYRLEAANGEIVLFGYIERGSQIDKNIANSTNQQNTPMILALKFPKKEVSRDQVIIDQFIGEGWVDPAVSGK